MMDALSASKASIHYTCFASRTLPSFSSAPSILPPRNSTNPSHELRRPSHSLCPRLVLIAYVRWLEPYRPSIQCHLSAYKRCNKFILQVTLTIWVTASPSLPTRMVSSGRRALFFVSSEGGSGVIWKAGK